MTDITNIEEEVNTEVESNEQDKVPTLDDLQSENATLKQQLKNLEDARLKAIKEAKGNKAKLKDANADAETIETVRSQMQETIDTTTTKYSTLVQRLADAEVSQSVAKALEEAKCLFPKHVSRDVMERIKAEYDEETGKTNIQVLTADGKPMFVKAKEATVADLVTSLARDESYAKMFEGAAGGTGATAARDLNTQAVADPFKSGNMTEQAKMKKENPSLYMALKKKHEDGKKPASNFVWTGR